MSALLIPFVVLVSSSACFTCLPSVWSLACAEQEFASHRALLSDRKLPFSASLRTEEGYIDEEETGETARRRNLKFHRLTDATNGRCLSLAGLRPLPFEWLPRGRRAMAARPALILLHCVLLN